jgi:hypothetical protein
MPIRRCLRSLINGGIGVATRAVTTGVLMTVVAVILSGCAYSRWYYATIDKPIRHDTWSLESMVRNANPESDTSATLYYNCILVEADTAGNRRLDIVVDSVRVSYGNSGWLTLPQSEAWTTLICETRVRQGREFGPIRIPKPRPDTLVVDQIVTVNYRDTGETLTRFRYRVKAALTRIRYWYLEEFLNAD